MAEKKDAAPSRLERLGQLLDSAIQVVAPGTALKRDLARRRMEVIRLHYEAGGRGRRFGKWQTPPTDADASHRGGQLELIRNRSRDLYRNNAHARRGIRVMTANVVGTGIRPQPFEGDTPDTPLSKLVKQTWVRWAESTDCDAEGRRDFYGLQRLVQKTCLQSGEVLVRRRIRRPSDGFEIPLQLQLIEPDFLDTTKDGIAKNGNVDVLRVQGVEFDLIGRRRGYWLFKEHPGSFYRPTRESFFVPASEILHVHASDRPGQVRGIPALASCVLRLRDLDEYLDATLLKMKLASMLTGFIQDPSEEPRPGDNVPKDEETDSDGTPKIEFEPGTLAELPVGKTISFSSPPSLEGMPDYVKIELRAIAVAIGVTYEQLTGDYSNVSFISGRMGSIENRQDVNEWRWDTIVPQFCDPVWEWFSLIAFLATGVRVESTRPVWTPPRNEMIDPRQEITATRLAVRTGLQSLSAAIREQGDEPDETLRELASDMDKARKLGLALEADPMLDANRNTGKPQPGSTAPKPAA